MTREDYDYLLTTYKKQFDRNNVHNRYIHSLEQRIAELETTRTCEGCKWDCPRESFIYDEYCSMCIRDNNKEDYYEPKDTK